MVVRVYRAEKGGIAAAVEEDGKLAFMLSCWEDKVFVALKNQEEFAGCLSLLEAEGGLRKEGRERPAGDGGGKRPRGARWGKGDGGRSRGLYSRQEGLSTKTDRDVVDKRTRPWINLPRSYTITK